jgi:hypothetical protein
LFLFVDQNIFYTKFNLKSETYFDRRIALYFNASDMDLRIGKLACLNKAKSRAFGGVAIR